MERLHKGLFQSRELWLLLPALALTGAALAYGAAAVRSRASASDMVSAESAEIVRAVELTGVVLREERLLAPPEAFFRPAAETGERLPAGTPLGVVYDDGAGYSLGALWLRLRRALDAASLSGETASPARLAQSAAAVRSAAALEDFAALADAAGRGAQALGSGPPRERLERELAALEAAGARERILFAPCPGFFSPYTDGRESLSPEDAGSISEELLSAAEAAVPRRLPGVARLVTGSGWTLTARLPPGEEEPFAPGRTLELELPDGSVVTARVRAVTTSESGERVVLDCREGTPAAMETRTLSVRAVSERIGGLLLPAAALRSDGEGTFVFRAAGVLACREPVTVLWTDGEKILVSGPGLRPGALVLTGDREYTDGEIFP